MQQLLGLFLKDFMSFFRTYLGYVLIFIYLSVSAVLAIYSGNLFSEDAANMNAFFSTQPLIFCFIIPVIAARIFGAEEEKNGNFEFLLTNPIKYKVILLAKFWAVFAYSSLLCLLSSVYIFYLVTITKINVALLVASYIGLILLIIAVSLFCCIANLISRNVFIGYLSATAISLLVYSVDFRSLSEAILVSLGIYSPIAFGALSLSENYSNFAHGEISLSSLLFFVALSCLCFWIAYLIFMHLRQKFQRKEIFIAISLSAVAYVMFALSFKLFFPSASIDLTRNDIYTISNRSRQIVSNVKDKVHIKLYISENFTDSYKNYKQYVKYVSSMLEKYTSVSGKITLEVLNPKPYSQEANDAASYGLEPILDNNGNVLYFGAVLLSSDNRKNVIPIFLKERSSSLEHDITMAIRDVGDNLQKPYLGIIATNLPILKQTYNDDFEDWVLVSRLSRYYNLVRVGEEGIPAEIKTVLIVNPHKISGAMQTSIEQHVLRGGNLVILADAYPEGEMEYASLISPYGVDINDFLSNFGVIFDADYIVSNSYRAGKVLMPDEGNKAFYDYPLWLNLQKDDLTENKISNNISSINLRSASQIITLDSFNDIVEDGSVNALIKIENNNGIAPVEYTSRDNLSLNKSIITKIDFPVNLGLMVKGKYNIAPHSKPRSNDEIILTASVKASTVAIIGDSDFVFNDSIVDKENSLGFAEYLYAEKNSNLQFLVNLLAYVDEDDFGQDIIKPLPKDAVTIDNMLKQKAKNKYEQSIDKNSSELALVDFSLSEIERTLKYSKYVITTEDASQLNSLRAKKEELQKERKELDYYLERDLSAQKAVMIIFLVFWIPLFTTLVLLLLYFTFLYLRKKSVRSIIS